VIGGMAKIFDLLLAFFGVLGRKRNIDWLSLFFAFGFGISVFSCMGAFFDVFDFWFLWCDLLEPLRFFCGFSFEFFVVKSSFSM
jgi:membrane-associated PAP2 superfamily phosphatase